MKSEATLPTSPLVRVLDSQDQLEVESDSRLLLNLPRSEEMNFTINGEDFFFTLTVDSNGHLTAFTATKDNTVFDCKIKLVSEADGSTWCCIPGGPCQQGSC